MKKKIEGVWYKGRFCPVWGGIYCRNREDFFRGGLEDISRAIKANMQDAAVVVEYDDGNDN